MYLLHGSREIRTPVRDRLVDVFLPGDLVAHLDTIFEERRVCVLCLLLVGHDCEYSWGGSC